MKLSINILCAILSSALILGSCTNSSQHGDNSNLLNLMADSIQAIKKSANSTSEIGIITSYFNSEDVVLVAGPVIEANRLVLYTKGEDVVGYYGWASQGEESYFLSGKINGNVIIGKKYSLYNK
jgi:hypothetical protein